MTKVVCSIVSLALVTNWICCEVSQWERFFTKQQKQKSQEGLPYEMVLQQRRQGCVFVPEGANKEPFTFTHAHGLYITAHECLLLTRQTHPVCELYKWAVNNHENNLRYSRLTRSQEGGLNNCLNPKLIYFPLHGKSFSSLEIKAASQMTCNSKGSKSCTEKILNYFHSRLTLKETWDT